MYHCHHWSRHACLSVHTVYVLKKGLKHVTDESIEQIFKKLLQLFFSVQKKTPKKHCISFGLDWAKSLFMACVYASVHDLGSLSYLHAFICMLVYGSMDKCKWLRECIWDELTSLPEDSKQWHDYCEVPSILMNRSTQLQRAVAPGTP